MPFEIRACLARNQLPLNATRRPANPMRRFGFLNAKMPATRCASRATQSPRSSASNKREEEPGKRVDNHWRRPSQPALTDPSANSSNLTGAGGGMETGDFNSRIKRAISSAKAPAERPIKAPEPVEQPVPPDLRRGFHKPHGKPENYPPA